MTIMNQDSTVTVGQVKEALGAGLWRQGHAWRQGHGRQGHVRQGKRSRAQGFLTHSLPQNKYYLEVEGLAFQGVMVLPLCVLESTRLSAEDLVISQPQHKPESTPV